MLKHIIAKTMSQSEIDEQLDLVREFVLRICQPLQIRVFGSASRGTMSTASDLDIAVIVDDSADTKAIRRSLYKKDNTLRCLIDFLVYTLSDYRKKLEIGGIDTLPELTNFAAIRRYEEGTEEITEQDLKNVLAICTDVINWASDIVDAKS